MNALLTRWREELAGDRGAKVAFQIVEILAANPFITPRSAEQRLGVAFNTIMRAIGQLEQRGIVTEVSGGKRDRVYCATALITFLEEPARLQPGAPF
jgi:Fic family protein